MTFPTLFSAIKAAAAATALGFGGLCITNFAALTSLSAIAEENTQRAPIERAAAIAMQGDAAFKEMQYLAAAEYYANAAATIKNQQLDKLRLSYLQREANALFEQGSRWPDNDALRSAIARQNELIALADKETRPQEWISAKAKLASSLLVLGERQKDKALKDQALTYLKDAQENTSAESAPRQWADVQTQLANTLAKTGKSKRTPEDFNQAAEIAEKVLKVISRDEFPDEWAAAKDCLGNALSSSSIPLWLTSRMNSRDCSGSASMPISPKSPVTMPTISSRRSSAASSNEAPGASSD